MITISLIGAGQRGLDTYAKYVSKVNKDIKFVSVCDIDETRRNQFKEYFKVDDSMIFNNTESFFSKDKLSDLIIIATLDDSHYEIAKKALNKRYDVILEKPIAQNLTQILELQQLAKKLNRQVIVCHVLRYHPMWQKIKSILDEGKLGKIMTIQHNENIGHYHYAHSYARGNWRNKETSGPIILTKSSHDLDILFYLVNSKVKKVASFGTRGYFIPENAPKDSAERCFDCKHQSICKYSGMRMYTSEGGFFPLFTKNKYTKKAIKEGLKKTDYGKCIYTIDHDVMESQSTILEFENGVNATFNLNAFTRKMHRSIKIMCEYGEIRANEKEIEVTTFHLRPLIRGLLSNILNINPKIKTKYKIYKWYDFSRFLGHIKADHHFIKTVLEEYQTNKKFFTTIDESLHSHIVAFAADSSRIDESVINIKSYENEHKLND